MKKRIISKIPHESTQIFCSQKYKGYYIRGWTDTQSDYFYTDNRPDGCLFYWRFFNLFLIHPNAEKSTYKDPETEDLLDVLEATTLSEYSEIKRAFYTDIAKRIPIANLSMEETINQYLQKDCPCIEIPLKNFNFSDSTYLDKAINNKEETILVETSVDIDQDSKENPQHIYYLAANHASRDSDCRDGDIASYFAFTPEIRQIGDMAWKWLKKKTLPDGSIKILNTLYKKLKSTDNPNELFDLDILDDFLLDLINSKILGQCSFCGEFFRYAPSKKYCSLAIDNKDCGTSARNKRYYSKHKAKILPRAKEYARKYRSE